MLEEDIISTLKGWAVEKKRDDIDAKIPDACNQRNVLNWAYQTGLYDGNEQVRDLAASLLEKAAWSEILKPVITNNLADALKRETSVYARFRMACALWNHCIKTQQVSNVLKNAPDDVKDIAQKYLKQQS